MKPGPDVRADQTALGIGLILASAQALSEAADDAPAPLLLLDEAAAHLDADRRAALFDELCALPGWLVQQPPWRGKLLHLRQRRLLRRRRSGERQHDF